MLSIAYHLAILCVFALLTQLDPQSPSPTEPVQNETQLNSQESGEIAADDDEPKSLAPANDKADTKEPNGPNHQARDNENGNPPVSWWTIADVTLTALFTACLVGVGLLQWCSMQKQAGHMRDGLALTRQAADAATKSAEVSEKAVEQMQLDQRPWLSIECAIQIDRPTAGRPVCWREIIRNSGKTPGTIAKDTILMMYVNPHGRDPRAAIVREELRLNLDMCKILEDLRTHAFSLKSGRVIPPGGSATIDTTGDYALSGELMFDIEHAVSILVVIAYMEYLDVAKKPHETWACFMYSAKLNAYFSYHDYCHMS